MPIDFTLPTRSGRRRGRVRTFMDAEVRPVADSLQQDGADRRATSRRSSSCASAPRSKGLWNPHLPAEWGGMGLGATAMAFVSAEAARVGGIGPYILNAQAPDEGNMHTLFHWATPEQAEKYLRPLAEGRARSCFAMTEPEVSGSDPTLIQTTAVKDGDDWVVNGHKWFISGARGAQFAILIARTDPDADPPQARNSAFLVDLPAEGWEIVRDIETMAGQGNHCEIRITNMRVPADRMLGGRGEGHKLGQYRLGPARLAHCMRWIGQAEVALELLVDRALKRYTHGSFLAEKQADPVDDRRLSDGALHRQADGAARRLQDREQAAVPAGGLVRQAPRRERALAHRRPRDPGARRARLLDRHAARRDAASTPARPASSTAPTKCTSRPSRATSSPPTRTPAAPGPPRASCCRENAGGR